MGLTNLKFKNALFLWFTTVISLLGAITPLFTPEASYYQLISVPVFGFAASFSISLLVCSIQPLEPAPEKQRNEEAADVKLEHVPAPGVGCDLEDDVRQLQKHLSVVKVRAEEREWMDNERREDRRLSNRVSRWVGGGEWGEGKRASAWYGARRETRVLPGRKGAVWRSKWPGYF